MGAYLVFVAQGFGLVLAVLALLWGLSALLGRIFAGATKATKPAISAPSGPPAPRATDAGIPAAHLAAISAAVAVATSERGRVVRVLAPAQSGAGWVGAGRSQQALSHRTRADWNASSRRPTASSSLSPEDIR